jgi:ketosteroid isomerase-like protein
MPEGNVAIAQRVVEDFNRDAADLDGTPEPRWAREEWIDPDVELVPLRAALEGTVYRPPDAAQQFSDDSRASWRALRLELREILGEGPGHVLAVNTLHGVPRETGLELAADTAMLLTFREGRVVRIATYPNESKALEAIGEDDA